MARRSASSRNPAEKKRPASTALRSGAASSAVGLLPTAARFSPSGRPAWSGAPAMSGMFVTPGTTEPGAPDPAGPDPGSGLLRNARDHAHAGGQFFHLQPGPQMRHGVVRTRLARNLAHFHLGLAQR